MKITAKTLMVSFETEVKLGNNDAIEMTLVHQAYIGEGEDEDICVDLDLSMDVKDIKFLGMPVDSGHTAYKEFKAQLRTLGIDIDGLIDVKEKELIEAGLEDELKTMFKDKF